MKKTILIHVFVIMSLIVAAQPSVKMVAPAKLDGKWGVIDNKGTWVIEAKYEDLGTFSQGLLPAKIKGKWGAINTSGKWVVKPDYSFVHTYNKGYAVVFKGMLNDNNLEGAGLYGMVDMEGKEAIPVKYEFLGEFSTEWLARAMTTLAGEKLWGYLGKDGKWAIPQKFHEAYDFFCGRAAVSESSMGVYYFINPKGEEAFEIPEGMNIQPRGTLSSFQNNMTHVWDVNRPKFIDTSGNIIIKAADGIAAIEDDFSEDLCLVLCTVGNTEKYGYMDKTGKLAIKAGFDWAGTFKGGIALAATGMEQVEGTTEKKGGFYGYINKAGEWVIKPEYTAAYGPSEGAALVFKDKKYGFLDRAGVPLTKIEYEQAKLFSNGYAAVKRYGKWGFIGTKGTIAVVPAYEDVKNFVKVKFE